MNNIYCVQVECEVILECFANFTLYSTKQIQKWSRKLKIKYTLTIRTTGERFTNIKIFDSTTYLYFKESPFRKISFQQDIRTLDK